MNFYNLKSGFNILPMLKEVSENYKDFEPEDFIDALDFVGVFENILEEAK